jgi:hypothetical protein
MHVALHRFEGVYGADEEIIRAANQLASVLSRREGFVSFALLDVGERAGVSITIFETQSELAEADECLDSWVVEHLAGWLSGPPKITTGEVVVQRGMWCWSTDPVPPATAGDLAAYRLTVRVDRQCVRKRTHRSDCKIRHRPTHACSAGSLARLAALTGVC